MHNEHEPPQQLQLSDAERREYSGTLTHLLLGSGLLLTVLAGTQLGEKLRRPEVLEPVPSPSVRTGTPEPSPSPSPREYGTLTITHPDGRVEVQTIGGPPTLAEQARAIHEQWIALGEAQASAVEARNLPAVLAEFSANGHTVTIHPKKDETSGITGLSRLAVAIDGQDQSLLLTPSRDRGLAVPDAVDWQWEPNTRALTVTLSEYNIEQLRYQWQNGQMTLVNYDKFQPMRDETKLTPAERKLPIAERAQLVFERGLSEHKQAERNAQQLLKSMQTGDWDAWATQLKRAYADRTSGEIDAIIQKDQRAAAKLGGVLSTARLDPTRFYPQHGAYYALVDQDGNPLSVYIYAGPGGAEVRTTFSE